MSAFDEFVEFGFGKNDDAVGKKEARFKVDKKGWKYRGSLAWWEFDEDGNLNLDSGTPKFVGINRVYIPGAGYVRARSQEFADIAKSRDSNSKGIKLAIGTLLVLWPTNKKGILDKARFAAGDAETLYWCLSRDKYDTLTPIHEEWGLGSSDLIITCTDAQYQSMTFAPTKDNLLRKLSKTTTADGKAMYARIVSEIKEMIPGVRNDIARDMSLSELKDSLRGKSNGSAGSSEDSDSDDDDDSADSASGEDVGELIGEYLE